MCFGSSTPPPATPEPAPPPAPSIPTAQSASASQSAAQAASPSQQIGFARKLENRKRFGKTSGPQGRRNEAAAATTPSTGDTGAGIRM